MGYEAVRLVIGKNTLYKIFCDDCKEYSLIGESMVCDCGNQIEIDSVISETVLSTAKRKIPTLKQKKELIEAQNNTCFYCGNDLDIYIVRKNKVIKLKVHFDHVIPYSHLLSNPDDNWVASCHICNQYKSNKIFDDINEIKEKCKNKWEQEIKSGKLRIL